jgi:hypothetical protein
MTVGVSMVASLGAMAAVGMTFTVALGGQAAYVAAPDTSLRRAPDGDVRITRHRARQGVG